MTFFEALLPISLTVLKLEFTVFSPLLHDENIALLKNANVMRENTTFSRVGHSFLTSLQSKDKTKRHFDDFLVVL